MPWPTGIRGPRRSPGMPSTPPGGRPTVRTPTTRRWSSSSAPISIESTVVGPAPGRPGPAGRDRPAHASPRGRARRRRRPHDPPPRLRRRADARPAHGQGGLLRRLVPRRLRHDPRRPGRPRDCRRVPSSPPSPPRRPRTTRTPSRGTWSISVGSAAATRRRTPWPRPSGGARRTRAGPSTSSARTSARSRSSPTASPTSRDSSTRSARRSDTRSGASSVGPRPSVRSR